MICLVSYIANTDKALRNKYFTRVIQRAAFLQNITKAVSGIYNAVTLEKTPRRRTGKVGVSVKINCICRINRISPKGLFSIK